MGRFDVRPAGERGPKPASDQGRFARLDRHAKPNASVCACITRHPVECLCCGRVLCFFCAGLIDLHVDLPEYLNRRNSDFTGEFPFSDPIEGI